jgi:transposase
MPPPLPSGMRSRIRIHFDRSDSTAFISKAIEVSLTQIRKMRRSYIVIDTVTASVGGRPSKLSDYHTEQLIKYLHQRLTVYQDEMI